MVATRQLTAADLLAMDPDAGRYELVEGALREMSPAGGIHGKIGSEIHGLLWTFARTHRLGDVMMAETGYIVASSPDTVLSPDVAFIRKERVRAATSSEGFIPFAPDLAIEIESPSNRKGELLAKVGTYLAGGSAEVWLVQPVHRSITIYRSTQPPVVFGPGETLASEALLPGFTLPLDALFSALDS